MDLNLDNIGQPVGPAQPIHLSSNRSFEKFLTILLKYGNAPSCINHAQHQVGGLPIVHAIDFLRNLHKIVTILSTSYNIKQFHITRIQTHDYNLKTMDLSNGT